MDNKTFVISIVITLSVIISYIFGYLYFKGLIEVLQLFIATIIMGVIGVFFLGIGIIIEEVFKEDKEYFKHNPVTRKDWLKWAILNGLDNLLVICFSTSLASMVTIIIGAGIVFVITYFKGIFSLL